MIFSYHTVVILGETKFFNKVDFINNDFLEIMTPKRMEESPFSSARSVSVEYFLSL